MTCCCRMLYPSYLPYYDSSCEYLFRSVGAFGLQGLKQTSVCLFLVAFCGGWAGVWQRRRESRVLAAELRSPCLLLCYLRLLSFLRFCCALLCFAAC